MKLASRAVRHYLDCLPCGFSAAPDSRRTRQLPSQPTNHGAGARPPHRLAARRARRSRRRFPHRPSSGPLAAAPPINLEAGPLGKLSLNGVVSGIGLFQSNAVPGNNGAEGTLTNGAGLDPEDRRLVAVLRAGGRL